MTGTEDATVVAAKRVVREDVRRRRAARATAERERDDRQRFDRVRELLSARPPRRLAAYLSAATEPDSRRLIEWATAYGIEVLVPVLTDGAGAWLPNPAWAGYDGPERLRAGRAGILEPTGPTLSDDALDTADLMIIPGLAADPRGNRLGRGGGWYDRARAGRTRLATWLLLNDDEVLDDVPTDAWDLPVHLIVTPTRTITAVTEAADPA